MTKCQWRESIMCLGSSHIDPERDELLKKTKLEIDNKVAKIYKFIKNKKQRKKDGKLAKDSELLELICDLHKQYQFLFSLYENLRGEVKEKVHSLENMESSSSASSSGSESESYYSVDEASDRSSPKHNLLLKVRDEFKDKHETSSAEFVDLKNKLISMTEEKEAVHSECMRSLRRIEESETIIKELKNEVELTDSTKQKLVNECMQLKEKLVERDNQLLSLTKDHQGYETKVPNRIKRFERKVSSLKLELKNMCSQKRELEEKAKAQSMENSGLRARILKLEMTSKDKEDDLSSLMTKLQENGRILDARNQVNVLQQELQSLRRQKSESESTVVKVTQEISNFLLQIQHLNDKLESKTMDLQIVVEEKEGLERKVQDLELEVSSMCNQKSELEEKARVEKEEFHVRITQLEQSSSEFENAASIRIKALGVERENLQQELDSLHAEKTQLKLEKQEVSEKMALIGKQNIELTSKISEQQTSLKGQEDLINKLNEEQKKNKKKIEETAEEFCKNFEDTLRIISRRILIVEQLHLENKDMYIKTKEKYKKENMDLMDAVKKMKEIIFTTNETLFGLDAVALKFEDCSGNLMNRISKASCEVLFSKHWVKRKNSAIKHVQDDLDCLLVHQDAKEREVLGLREKVWKLENKVRELEKMVKEKEEWVLGIGEEKREAIRQLCVWIDYHRSRTDYLKKIISTIVRSQRTS